jgi:oxygen-independent coproporphyrinogen III oxidase
LPGLYIHIPFCRKACFYCNFHFTVNTRGLDDMLSAILREAEMRAQSPAWQIREFDSLYLGGGTPSIVESGKMLAFIAQLKRLFPVKSDAEITLEANPDDVNEASILAWQAAGANRISLGVQDFDDTRLEWMNRSHGATEAIRAIEFLQRAGFPSLNIDLIYGVPGLDEKAWAENLSRVFQSGADHLSAYALTLESRTPYAKLVQQGRYAAPEEQRQATHFSILMEMADAAGWHHYEISNLSKPGFEARHNSAYWKNEPYLGLGPSAHSYDGLRRSWNPSDNRAYMQMAETGLWESEGEILGATELLNERIMTRIRMSEGLNLQEADALHPGWLKSVSQEIARLIEIGWAVKHNEVLKLTREGRFYADAIASGLMMVDSY